MRQFKIAKAITNRETASLDKYLQDIGKIKLITAEEEVALAQLIKQGDDLALKRLVEANLRFVVSVAKQYQNQGLSLSDIVNEGNLGLIKAAQRFDETRGFKFISYAVWWIRQGILQALAEQSRIVRLPLNQVAGMNRVKKTRASLEQRLERMPSNKEVAQYLEIREDVVELSLENALQFISMDAPLSMEDESVRVGDMMADENPTTDSGLMKESLSKDIKRAISLLTEKEQEVLNLYYGFGLENGLTLEEIGTKLNITRERVRQIKERALRRLKNQKRSKALKEYV